MISSDTLLVAVEVAVSLALMAALVFQTVNMRRMDRRFAARAAEIAATRRRIAACQGDHAWVRCELLADALREAHREAAPPGALRQCAICHREAVWTRFRLCGDARHDVCEACGLGVALGPAAARDGSMCAFRCGRAIAKV